MEDSHRFAALFQLVKELQTAGLLRHLLIPGFFSALQDHAIGLLTFCDAEYFYVLSFFEFTDDSISLVVFDSLSVKTLRMLSVFMPISSFSE